ncbi:ATP-binding cassette sub-family B member 9 [Micractinium conductrix]|uniref:ATP-binding cassette sub-family B member 9 n=1 Tax=Micractinium conductrix TaxID=554055 RepID=A0A2P6VB18_9CHLO|nr:ATP-binding cassette sub-family B member 9 [Micractinium conductrix]|eukprot:PSC71292.1 ATP-binding cassette sub-family B member 9 [Micractinium conductrix]
MRVAAALWAAWLLKLGVVTAAALYPLRGQLWRLARLCDALELYSLANSNLDVWVLTLAHTTVVAALLSRVVAPARRFSGLLVPPPYGKVGHGLRWSSTLFELLLLAKAVTVAVLGEEALLPPPPGQQHPTGNAGLLCIYAALGAALLCSFAEGWLSLRLVQRWRKAFESSGGARASGSAGDGSGLATQPLLGKAGGGGEERDKASATIPELIGLSAPDTHILMLAFTAGAAAALGQALIPYYTGKIIDYASIDPDPPAFKRTTLKMLGVALGCAVFTGIRGGLFTVAMTRLNVRIRQQLFASLMGQDAAFFDATKTGEITSRLAADTTTVSDQICLNLNVMLRSSTQAAMVLVFMFSASWRLTVVTFVMIPLVLAVCKLYGAYYRQLSKKVQTELAEANSVAEEALSSMTTVKSHAAEDSTLEAYAEKLRRFYKLQRREAVAYALYMMTNTFLAAAVVAAVLFYGGTLVLRGAMSAGSLVSFMLFQQSLSAAFQALGDVFSALSAAVGAADKVVELMRRQPAVAENGTVMPADFAGKITLQDVSFHYPARPTLRVLTGLSLTVNPGEIVALVGPSGGGKSSIVKLVERFYLPDEGRVLIDDRPVGEYDRKWLKRRVALVSQEPVLYARSIRRNILYGLQEEDGVPPDQVPTDEDVEQAARLANAHSFITALPDGYDTECGEKGVQLSGGQKQRIAIARALVRKPAVLLLDEATSALDADSEAVVQEALDRTMKNRTVLVIAHRLSTVQDAHRIVVIQHGQVAEQGSHEALLEAGGVYAQLVRRQLARAPSTASLHPSASSASLSLR